MKRVIEYDEIDDIPYSIKLYRNGEVVDEIYIEDLVNNFLSNNTDFEYKEVTK